MTTEGKNRSFVLRAVKDVVLEDRAIPALKDAWDVRVHVAQTGICGSDVHYWQRGRIGGKIEDQRGKYGISKLTIIHTLF